MMWQAYIRPGQNPCSIHILPCTNKNIKIIKERNSKLIIYIQINLFRYISIDWCNVFGKYILLQSAHFFCLLSEV